MENPLLAVDAEKQEAFKAHPGGWEPTPITSADPGRAANRMASRGTEHRVGSNPLRGHNQQAGLAWVPPQAQQHSALIASTLRKVKKKKPQKHNTPTPNLPPALA